MVKGLPEISQGEFWRLFTPGPRPRRLGASAMNMMWLLDLGSMIEGRQSTDAWSAGRASRWRPTSAST